MKIAAVVLFLACAALAGKFAVQSYPLLLQWPGLAQPRDVLTTLSEMGLTFPAIPSTADKVEPLQEPAPPPARILDQHEMQVLISTAAVKHRVPAAFVKSIVAAESNFDCGAVSPKGAIGLMQLMPATAEEYGADPAIPEQNIDAGTRYLRFLMDRYGKHNNSLKRVIAAYNAGPGNVDRFRGVPPFRETRTYVTRVLGFLREFDDSRKLVANGRLARRVRGRSVPALRLE